MYNDKNRGNVRNKTVLIDTDHGANSNNRKQNKIQVKRTEQ